MKRVKPDHFLFMDDYKKEQKQEKKKHKELRDQRKAKHSRFND